MEGVSIFIRLDFYLYIFRLAKEHLQPTTQDSTAAASELLILSLDLVKNRVAVMGQDIRKAFIGSILVGLIEKSTDVKVMKAITKMLEDWMKNKDVKMMNQGSFEIAVFRWPAKKNRFLKMNGDH